MRAAALPALLPSRTISFSDMTIQQHTTWVDTPVDREVSTSPIPLERSSEATISITELEVCNCRHCYQARNTQIQSLPLSLDSPKNRISTTLTVICPRRVQRLAREPASPNFNLITMASRGHLQAITTLAPFSTRHGKLRVVSHRLSEQRTLLARQASFSSGHTVRAEILRSGYCRGQMEK